MLKTLAVAAMFLAAHAAAFAQTSGTVTGRVFSTDGTPAANVRVAAVPEGQSGDSPGSTLASLAETNSAGQYWLENIPPGEYHIVAGLLEWLTYYPGVKNAQQARLVSVTAGRTVSATDFTLQRPVRLRVSGRIVRTRESVPLPQRIMLNGNSMNGQSQLTVSPAADGTFEFKEVTPGNYNLQVSPGIPGVSMQQFAVGDKDVEGLEFVVPLNRTVRGRIEIDGGTPTPPMSLSFIGARGNFTARSNSPQNATFSITLPEGEHRMSVTGFPGGLAVKSVTMGSVDLLRNLLVIGDAEPEEIVVAFSAPTAPIYLSIKGRVVRPAGSTGSAPTRVTLTGSGNMEASIAPDGSFEFPYVLPGNYQARIPSNATYPGVPLNLFKDIANLELVLPLEHEVKGRVLVEQDGFLPRFTITATGTQSYVVVNGPFKLTLAEGEQTLRVSGLPAGYTVRSMRAGDVDLLLDKLKSSSTSEIVVTLGVGNPPPWRAVRGRIVDPSANASLELRVRMSGEGYEFETKAGIDGAFEFPKVLQGSYTVQAVTDADLAPLRIVVADRDVNDVRIVMPRVR